MFKRRAWIAGLLSVAMMMLMVGPAAAAPPAKDTLSVAADLTDAATGAVVGTFEGTLEVTDVAVENGQLVVDGILNGTLTSGDTVVDVIDQVVSGIIGGKATCDILQLDLGPLFLDLLGLQVDLSEVNLEITAVAGPGNLLGNLLCAVAGLLDRGGPVDGLLGAISRLLGWVTT